MAGSSFVATSDSTGLNVASPVAILTGGIDRPYVFGLSTALSSKGTVLDVVGSDEMSTLPKYATAPMRFLNLYGDQRKKITRYRKVLKHLAVYSKLLIYAANTETKVFHILWNNKFKWFDRTILMLYYKLLGKRIVLTAHNVNTEQRDGRDSAVNRFTLKVQYRLVDHIFVHTNQMRDDLLVRFAVKSEAVSVIPFGVNNSVPDTYLTSLEAKQKLGLKSTDKAMLFFGGIRPYKGLEYLAGAFRRLAREDASYKLIVAGEPTKEAVQYWGEVEQSLSSDPVCKNVIKRIMYIDDADTEIYFKGADVTILPYTGVYQSGVLFLAYSFGLPVIVTDVGSLRDDVIPGETGYICQPCDEASLAESIRTYFDSELFPKS